MRLLSTFLDFLFPVRDTEGLVRDATVTTLGTYARPSIVEETITLLPYRSTLVKACIVEAKFRDNTKAQILLGTVLADYLAEIPEPLYVIPIPLSTTRYKERGYNQTERIAREALPRLPGVLLDTTILKRVRDTIPQTSLGGRARRTNLAGAFHASGVNPAHTYIVVDDVMTTGATLKTAVSALKEAGAVRIIAIALAH